MPLRAAGIWKKSQPATDKGKDKDKHDSVIDNACTFTEESASCRTCSLGICLTCKAAAHGDSPCDPMEIDEDEQLKAQLAKWGYKRCPRCGHGVRRMYGCPHMQCVCGEHFCWSCAKTYSEEHDYCGEGEDSEDEDPYESYSESGESEDGDEPKQSEQSEPKEVNTAGEESNEARNDSAAATPESQDVVMEVEPAASTEDNQAKETPTTVPQISGPLGPNAGGLSTPYYPSIDGLIQEPNRTPDVPLPTTEYDDLPELATEEDALSTAAVASTEETPRRRGRRRRNSNLDAGGDQHWEYADVNFGDEPVDDAHRNVVWDGGHRWAPMSNTVYNPDTSGFSYATPLTDDFSRTVECHYCWTPIKMSLDEHDTKGDAASQCAYCALVVCKSCTARIQSDWERSVGVAAR